MGKCIRELKVASRIYSTLCDRECSADARQIERDVTHSKDERSTLTAVVAYTYIHNY